MRILIVEEALQSSKGHWPSYIGGIAGGMRAAGNDVDVLTQREATASTLADVGGTPWFSKNCWVDAASQGALGGIRHNFTFRSELADWLRSNPPYDWVCALTMRLQHLLAFALLSREKKLPPNTRFLLLFVQGFGHYVGPGQLSIFPNTPSNHMARFCFHLLASAVRSGRILLAAETLGMQDELQRFTRLPVSLFPHPVPPASEYRQPTNEDEITITCPGFARHEKGNDLLQEAILAILSSPDNQRFRFIMQWAEPFAMPNGSLLSPHPRLLNDPRVEFLNQSLDSAAYEQLLARSHLVILPYRQESYHHRVSRVAIEAASRGIPIIYTRGTWMSEIAKLAGCGIEIEEESASSIQNALERAATGYQQLKEIALRNASKVASFHSTNQFSLMLKDN